MQVVNGKEKEIVDMLRGFSMCGYEARMYFTLLTIGEAKVMDITKKASIPQSKAYDVLESLVGKGFVEMTRVERPKAYRAKVLEEITDIVKRAKQREIQELEKNQSRLYEILQGIEPVHRKYGSLRLFSPSYEGTRFHIKGGDEYAES